MLLLRRKVKRIAELRKREMFKFIKKSIFIHFLVVLLVDGPYPIVLPMLSSTAFSTETTVDLDYLLNQYNSLATHTESLDRITGDMGKELLGQGQEFVANSNNRTVLATPAGQAFLNLHNKFTRIRVLKEKLDNCVSGELNDPKYTNRLPERILSAAIQLPGTEIPCQSTFFEAESLDLLLGGIRGAVEGLEDPAKAKEFSDFQANIHIQGLENSVKALVNLKYTYDESIGTQDSLSDSTIDANFVDKVCVLKAGKRKVNKCSSQQKSYLRNAAKKEFDKLKLANAARYTPQAAASDIRNRIEEVNGVIETLEFDIDDGWISDSINTQSEKSQESHQRYVETFMRNADSGPGLLMWTDAIGSEMGSRRDRDEASVFGLIGGGFDAETGKYKKHSLNIDESHVRGAIAEAESRVIDQTKSLMRNESERQADDKIMTEDQSIWVSDLSPAEVIENRRESLKEMVGVNPVLVGQALMKDPTKVDEACTVINDIAQDAKDNDGWTLGKVAMWGGLIVGGGLAIVATGGLALAAFGGAAALTGATVASAGALALAGTTFKALAVAGFVYGVAETGVYGSKYLSAARERDEMLASYLSGGGDDVTADQFLVAMSEAEDALINASMAAGFTLLDVPGAVAIARHLRGTERMNYLADLKEAGGLLRRSSKLRGVLSGVRESLGAEGVQAVLRQITKLEDGISVLRKIENLNPQQAKELFENGLKVCNDLCS